MLEALVLLVAAGEATAEVEATGGLGAATGSSRPQPASHPVLTGAETGAGESVFASDPDAGGLTRKKVVFCPAATSMLYHCQLT